MSPISLISRIDLGTEINPVFTRVVNHCVIVVGLKGGNPIVVRDEGESLFGALRPNLVTTESSCRT
jgi:hypothetical protein